MTRMIDGAPAIEFYRFTIILVAIFALVIGGVPLLANYGDIQRAEALNEITSLSQYEMKEWLRDNKGSYLHKKVANYYMYEFEK